MQASLAAASTGGESESGAGRGGSGASPPPPPSTLFGLYYAEPLRDPGPGSVPGPGSWAPRPGGALSPGSSRSGRPANRAETGREWRAAGGQSYVTCGRVRVHLRSARHAQLNSAGPATSTSAEQPAASPPLLPSITNSFLSSFPPSFLSRILSLSVLPAYSPYARARSGNYGNGSNVDGHAHQRLFWLHEWEARAPLFPNFFL